MKSARYFRHIMIGTKLAHYEITSHMGTGGMGLSDCSAQTLKC